MWINHTGNILNINKQELYQKKFMAAIIVVEYYGFVLC